MALPREEELKAEISALRKQLGLAEAAKNEAQELAKAVASASPFISNTEEQPTGNTVSMEVCANPWVKDAKKQKWITVEVPTFYYAITLPAGAGTHLSTNGVDYYHGHTYEVDSYQLAELKSRVARCWDHEKMIHGDNENAYRKPTHVHLRKQA